MSPRRKQIKRKRITHEQMMDFLEAKQFTVEEKMRRALRDALAEYAVEILWFTGVLAKKKK